MSALGPESTLEELAAAFARPMIRALAAGGRDLAVMRIVARAGIDPPEGWDRLNARFERIRADVLRVLKANVPEVKDKELIFRTRCVAGMLNWLALAPVGTELRDKSEKQLERLLVPTARRRLPRHELRLTEHCPNISSSCLTRCQLRYIQASD